MRGIVRIRGAARTAIAGAVFALAGALALVALEAPGLHSPAPIDVGSVPDVEGEVAYREVPARTLTPLGDRDAEDEARATALDAASGPDAAGSAEDPTTVAPATTAPGGSGGGTTPTAVVTDPLEGAGGPVTAPTLPPPPATLPTELDIPGVTTVPLPPLTLPPPDEEPVVTLPRVTLPPTTLPQTTVPPTTIPLDLPLIDDLPWFDLERAGD